MPGSAARREKPGSRPKIACAISRNCGDAGRRDARHHARPPQDRLEIFLDRSDPGFRARGRRGRTRRRRDAHHGAQLQGTGISRMCILSAWRTACCRIPARRPKARWTRNAACFMSPSPARCNADLEPLRRAQKIRALRPAIPRRFSRSYPRNSSNMRMKKGSNRPRGFRQEALRRQSARGWAEVCPAGDP